MSKILKGIINESNPFYGHNDPAREYGADAPSYPKRGRHTQTDDDEYDPYGLIRQEKDFAKGRAMKAAAEKAQRDSDHDRLATGTNESLDDPWGDQGNFVGNTPQPNIGGTTVKRLKVGDTVKYLGQLARIDAMSKTGNTSRITIINKMGGVTQDVLTSDLKRIHSGMTEAGTGLDIDRSIPGRTIARISGDIKHRTGSPSGKKLPDYHPDDEYDQWSGKVDPSIHDDEEDTFHTDYTGDEEGELKEISNEKLAKYKTAAAADAGKADKEGDYKRGDKRFSGIVKATKKQFANDTKKSSISQGINEFAPIKPPTAGAFGGNKDYGQPNSSRYIGGNKFVVGTTNNYVLTATIDKWGLEWDEDDEIWFLDSPGAAHIADASEGEIELPPPREQRNQIHDLVTDYLNERNSADLQKVAAYYGHSDDGEMATNEGTADEKPVDPFKTGYPRVNNPKILGTQNRAKSAYHPPARPPIKKLDKPLPENLGNELKSKSLEALQQVKQQLEQQRMADLEQWEKDFKQNTVAKFTAREPNLNQRATSTPMVAMPGEKHSELKTRLGQLNKAIEKQGILDNLVQKLDKKGLMTPNIEAGVDTSMLVRDGARDNYVELNKKLDKALEYVKNRLLTNKAAYAKPKAIDEDDGAPTRMRMNDYYDLADSIQEKLRHAIQMGDKARIQELNKQRDELDAHVKKHGMMPENVDEADMNRRGFLGQVGKAAGAGALAAAGLGGAGNAQAFKGTLPAPAPSISEDEAEAQIKELRSKAYKELASMMWNVWPKILDTTFGANTPQDKPATPEEIGKMLGYRLAEYADDYRQKVRAIKVAAGVRDPQSLNKTTAAIYVNEQEIDEEKQRLDPKCWKGYKKQGTKMKGGTRVNNCVPVSESSILTGLKKV